MEGFHRGPGRSVRQCAGGFPISKSRRRAEKIYAGRLMIYTLCAVLGGAVLTAIFVPLFRKEQTLESAILEETQWDLLQRKKEVVLGNVQDLDFEYKCGKLSDADYQRIRAEMMEEAAAVLDQIEKLEASL